MQAKLDVAGPGHPFTSVRRPSFSGELLCVPSVGSGLESVRSNVGVRNEELDNFVGLVEQRLWNCEAQCRCGFFLCREFFIAAPLGSPMKTRSQLSRSP